RATAQFGWRNQHAPEGLQVERSGELRLALHAKTVDPDATDPVRDDAFQPDAHQFVAPVRDVVVGSLPRDRCRLEARDEGQALEARGCQLRARNAPPQREREAVDVNLRGMEEATWQIRQDE